MTIEQFLREEARKIIEKHLRGEKVDPELLRIAKQKYGALD